MVVAMMPATANTPSASARGRTIRSSAECRRARTCIGGPPSMRLHGLRSTRAKSCPAARSRVHRRPATARRCGNRPGSPRPAPRTFRPKWPAFSFPFDVQLSGGVARLVHPRGTGLPGKVELLGASSAIGLADAYCTRCRQPIREMLRHVSAAAREAASAQANGRQYQKHQADRPRYEYCRVSIGDLQSALEVLLDDRLQHESQQKRRWLTFPLDEQIADESENHKQKDIESRCC